MVEKRARKDVKRLSAKVDAFIRKVEKKSSSKHHKHTSPHHEHPHQAHVPPHHKVHHEHHLHHNSAHHVHPQHAQHTASHESHSHHHEHPHHKPQVHHSNHPAQHIHHHEQPRENSQPMTKTPATHTLAEHKDAHEQTIRAAVTEYKAPELPPMPTPPQKKELVENMEHKPSVKRHVIPQGVKIKKTFPISHPQPTLRNEFDIAVKFASQVHKKFATIIKATVLFGSQAKRTAVASSDIDIVIIVDDASINWDLELIAWYREELGKLVAANKYAHELHVNTIKLTTWWQDLINGDPVVLNILRYGEPLIDIAGFFKPLKALLYQGKIHSTPESVYNALQRAPMHLSRSRASELGAIEGVYWTMVDSAQAALITAGQLPPSPEHMTAMLKETFVDKGLMKADFVYWYRDCFALHKAIIHGHVTNLKGADIDVWQGRAEQFMKKMTEIIDNLLSTK